MHHAVGQGTSTSAREGQPSLQLTAVHALGLTLDKGPRYIQLGPAARLAQAQRGTYSIHLPFIWRMTSIASWWVDIRIKPLPVSATVPLEAHRRRPMPSSWERRIECSTRPKGENSALNSILPVSCLLVEEAHWVRSRGRLRT